MVLASLSQKLYFPSDPTVANVPIVGWNAISFTWESKLKKNITVRVFSTTDQNTFDGLKWRLLFQNKLNSSVFKQWCPMRRHVYHGQRLKWRSNPAPWCSLSFFNYTYWVKWVSKKSHRSRRIASHSRNVSFFTKILTTWGLSLGDFP